MRAPTAPEVREAGVLVGVGSVVREGASRGIAGIVSALSFAAIPFVFRALRILPAEKENSPTTRIIPSSEKKR
jgi:hypothetical protein